MTSAAIVDSVVNHMLIYDVEKVRRLKWAQENAADHSRSEASQLMRESVNQFAFKNVDGGKRWDPVKTNEKDNLATQLKSIDEGSDGASGEQSRSSDAPPSKKKADTTAVANDQDSCA